MTDEGRKVEREDWRKGSWEEGRKGGREKGRKGGKVESPVSPEVKVLMRSVFIACSLAHLNGKIYYS